MQVRLRETPPPNILGDTHHGGVARRITSNLDLLAERVLVWPDLFRHGFTHAHPLRRAGAILRGDPAAAYDARSHGREVFRRARLQRELAELVHGIDSRRIEV